MEWANDALVGCMNDRIYAGPQAHVGDYLLVALMSDVPEFSKTGRRTRPEHGDVYVVGGACAHLDREGLIRCQYGRPWRTI